MALFSLLLIAAIGLVVVAATVQARCNLLAVGICSPSAYCSWPPTCSTSP